MEKLTSMICAKCGRQPSDMLILVCSHNLCLICASKEMLTESISNKEKHVILKQKIICDICSLTTELDPSSVIELLKLCEEELIESRYEREMQFQYNEYSDSKEYCRSHLDEPLTYYCLDCRAECICSECVIHGDHNGHDVLQIRKAYPKIKDELEEIYFNITSKKDEIELKSEKIENKKTEIIDQGNTAKQQVQISFEDLRNRLDKKERDILAQIEKVVQDNLREAENYNRIINGKLDVLERISETVKSVLSGSSQVELLEFYSENKEKILENVDNELATLGNIDKSTNLRCVILPQSLAEHIDSVKTVQIHISTLKCTDEPVVIDRAKRNRMNMNS